MPRFGGFETVREINRSAFATVWSARPVDAPADALDEHIVKFVHPLGAVGEEASDELELFLEAAQVQRELAASGAKHWAPILECGHAEGGAYYVSKQYHRSGAQLVRSRVRFSALALGTIVDTVIQGLREIRETCGRPHGDVKPSNVLIESGGDISRTTIVLTDPLPSSQLAATAGEAGDVQGVGRLIHQLVLHTRFERMGGWPIPKSPEWRRLGRTGQRWRDLTTCILDPNAAAADLTLEWLAGEVAKLRTRKAPLKLIGIAVAAVLVVAAAGVGGWLIYRNRGNGKPVNGGQKHVFSPAEWKRLCDEYYYWFGALQSDLTPEVAARWRKDEGLAKVLDLLAKAKESKTAFDPRQVADDPGGDLDEMGANPPEGASVQPGVDRTYAALAVIDKVEAGLSRGQWESLKATAQLSDAWRERQWRRPAAFLAGLVAEIQPSRRVAEIDTDIPSPKAVHAVGRLLDVRDKLLPPVDAAWTRVVAGQDILDKSGDPILKRLRDHWPAEAVSEEGKGSEEDLETLRTRCEGIAKTVEGLTTFVQGDWKTQVDRELFIKDSAVHRTAEGAVTRHTLRLWREQVKDYYRLAAAEDPRKAEDWAARIAQTARDLATLANAGAEAKARADTFRKRLDDDVRPAVQAMGQLPAVRKTRADLQKQADDVKEKVDALAEEVSRATIDYLGEPKEWLVGILNFDFKSSAAVNTTWQARRTQLLQGVTPQTIEEKRDLYRDIRPKVQALQEALGGLEGDPKLPRGMAEAARTHGSRTWYRAFAAALAIRREAVLKGALDALSWEGAVPKVDDDAFQARWDAMKAAYRQARADAADAIVAFAAIEAGLDACYLLDETPPGAQETVGALYDTWSKKPVLAELKLAPALRPIAARVDALRKLADVVDRAELVRTALDTSRREVALAVWRKLDTLEPAWPNSDAELKQSADIRTRLLTDIRVLRDPARSKTLAAAVDRTQKARRAGWLALLLDRRRNELAPVVTLIEAGGDPILAKFGALVNAEIDGIAAADLEARLAKAAELKQYAEPLRAFVEGDWAAKVAQDLFKQSGEVKLPEGGTPTRETYAAWLEAVKGYYKIDPKDDPRGSKAKWDADVASTRRGIAAARRFGPEAAKGANALEEKLKDQIEPQITALWAIPPVSKHRAELADKTPKARQALTQLVEGVGSLIETPEDFYKRIRAIAAVAKSPAVNALWIKRRGELMGLYDPALLAADHTLYFRVRTGFETLIAFLGGLEKTASLPAGLSPDARKYLPKSAQGALTRLLAQRREQALAKLVSQIPWDQAGFPAGPVADLEQSAAWKAAAGDYNRFRTDMESVIPQTQMLGGLLDAGYLPDDKPERAPKTIRQLYADWNGIREAMPDLRAAFASVERKMAAIEAVEQIDRAGLVARLQALRPADPPQVPLLVWRRLSATADWPRDLAELRLAVEARGAALKVANAIAADNPHPVRWVGPAASQGGLALWERCFTRLVPREPLTEAAENTLVDALKLAPSFGVAGAKLQPATRLRIHLLELRGAILSLPEGAAKARATSAVAAFRQKVGTLGPLGQQPDVLAFVAQLDRLVSQQVVADPTGGFDKAGPATYTHGGGWRPQPAPDGASVTYTWARGHSLEFRRVSAGGGAKPTFLSSAEVSLGLFIDVVTAANQWGAAMPLLREYDRMADPRKGPRVWELTRDGKAIQPSLEWLVRLPGVREPYPAGLRPQRPGKTHPVQYVSPEAAMLVARLLGCRLPTSAEWQAAATLDRGQRANLRGATWQRQQAHTARLWADGARADWPDSGIFFPAGVDIAESGDATPATDVDDGILWFAPVGTGSGFHHLVGNVAEMVFDDAPAFDAAFKDAARLSSDALTEFVGKGAKQLKVVGASALSPPELWNGRDKPFTLAYPAVVDEIREGLSDVGFRLAFAAPTESIVARVKRLVAQQGLMPGVR